MNATIILLLLAVIGTATSLVLFTIEAFAEHRAKRDIKTSTLAEGQAQAEELSFSDIAFSSRVLVLGSAFSQVPTKPAVAISFRPVNPNVISPPLGRASEQSRQQMVVMEMPPLFADKRFTLQLPLTPTSGC